MATRMTNLFDLSGKVAVVTGSTRGLGFAIAEAMTAHGATVIVSSENADDTAAAAAALGATGIACDVSDDARIKALVAETVERFGGIDILVSNAGIQGGPSADPLDMTVFDRVIAVNLRSMAVLAKHALPVMAGRAGASVTLVASLAGSLALAEAGSADAPPELALGSGALVARANTALSARAAAAPPSAATTRPRWKGGGDRRFAARQRAEPERDVAVHADLDVRDRAGRQ